MAALALALVGVLLGVLGCGNPVSGADEPDPVVSEPTPPAVPSALTCSTSLRSKGIFDHFSGGGGDPTPVRAARRLLGSRMMGQDQRWRAVPSDRLIVEPLDRDGHQATRVWVLRADGTAMMSIGIDHLADGTFMVGSTEACGSQDR